MSGSSDQIRDRTQSARGGSRSAFLILLFLLPGPVLAQSTATLERGDSGMQLELRVGVVASTPLVRDRITAEAATPSPGIVGSASEVELTPSVAPMVVGSARFPFGSGWAVQGSLGWTFGDLEASDAQDEWRVGELSVGHAMLGIHRRLGRRFYARAAGGAVRYDAPDAALFSEGAVLRAALEAGAGVRVPLRAVALLVDGTLQAHGFGTPSLRGAGGDDGSVYRFALQLGAEYGGGAR